MRAPNEPFDFVHEFLIRICGEDLYAKRVLSLANGTLGVMTGAALAVGLIGQALATARGLVAKSAIKQVDRLPAILILELRDFFRLWSIGLNRFLVQASCGGFGGFAWKGSTDLRRLGGQAAG